MIEENKYMEQYGKAIFKLMDCSDISQYEYPLINLVHQLIENQVKSLIAESWYCEKTYTELGINNEHSLLKLINRNELKKYYDGIEIFEKIFQEFKEKVLYFYNILGDNTFLNSRYAIEVKCNNETLKKKFNHDEFYSNWFRYSELYSCMMIMYTAYSYSNTILYFMKKNYNIQKLVNIKLQILQEMSSVSDKESLKLLDEWIDKFVERNKYYDEKYIN